MDIYLLPGGSFLLSSFLLSLFFSFWTHRFIRLRRRMLALDSMKNMPLAPAFLFWCPFNTIPIWDCLIDQTFLNRKVDADTFCNLQPTNLRYYSVLHTYLGILYCNHRWDHTLTKAFIKPSFSCPQSSPADRHYIYFLLTKLKLASLWLKSDTKKRRSTNSDKDIVIYKK